MSDVDVLLEASELDSIAARLGAEISADHPDGVLLVGVLKSALPALADIARALTVPAQVDFLALSPFAPDSGRVRLLKDLDRDVAGQAVVLVTGLVDTGLKIGFLRGEVGRRNPASLRVCTMFDKRERRILPVELDYVGATVPNGFVIGYGLDYDGRYRNASRLALVERDALASDPDCCVPTLYR
ncbi:MAG: hypoxanthine phosphoribosyltransferase [Acidimicrobiales bacterium]|nr:hypoxanthine phosphoribosyltransferase [Acidimicrobiales bacterium]